MTNSKREQTKLYAQKLAAKMDKISAKKPILLNTEAPGEMTEVGQKLLDELGFKKVKLRIWFDNTGMTRAVGIWNFDLNGKNVQGYRNFGGPNDTRKMYANYGDCLVDCISYAATIEKGLSEEQKQIVEDEIYRAAQKLSWYFKDNEQN